MYSKAAPPEGHTISTSFVKPWPSDREPGTSENVDRQVAHFPFLRREEGQGLAEYALILSLIAIVVVAVLLFMGGNIKTILSTIGKAL